MTLPTKQEPSIKLRMMLEEVNQAFGYAKKAVMAAYNQALSEGYSPQEAKQLILSLVHHISPRTIYLYLPDESKDKKMQALALKKRTSLQSCNDKKQNNNSDLLDSDGGRHIKESKTDRFMENLRKELDTRKITKAMYS
jgi:hypothetical protein